MRMGNCLVQEEKVIKVMKTDGKILEYRAPMKVHEVLSEFSGHALSDSLPEIQHLHQDVKLLGGNLYYLVPLPLPSPKVEKKKVRFSDQEEGDGQRTGIVRIKLVISKQELQELLQKGGVSVQDMVSQIQGKQTTNDVDTFHGGDNCKGWKPELESIPEVD
ncbi:hypothetical protein JRO89_XS12G0093600 [Xanthoceras sorbifolium]|uniref:Uncharacterized protein n=1 Tax=Xanthoceras sorbifolium TaxID=99658 RepID=A0ABQ8HBZ2_9ROSI|nr:hypothetical protein JRO89_XS12G0093600 [Xanthoceras sorbifolium]